MHHIKFEKNLPCTFYAKVKNVLLLTHDGKRWTKTNNNSSD